MGRWWFQVAMTRSHTHTGRDLSKHPSSGPGEEMQNDTGAAMQIGKSTNSAPITQAKSEFHFIDNISTITTAQVISVQSILNSKTPPDSDSKTEGTTLPVFNLNLETNKDAKSIAEEECINLDGRETALNNGTKDGATATERVEAASLEPAEARAKRPPPEPPDLEPLVEITDAGRLRSLDNDEYAEYGVIKEEKRQNTVTTLVNEAATLETSGATVRGFGSRRRRLISTNREVNGLENRDTERVFA
ncbi:hypothetical protein PIB30_032781 [Stylosanthes scabra]|uniref:Uncharacterized protein n=1 Tax=Stylosanthes scabra TaxID=79078 RepID=A0ABU6VEG4_9FABA|nr:hypothetical protein [Stylosanthes scabra]